MRCLLSRVAPFALAMLSMTTFAHPARAEVRAWEGTITIPTYPWEDDINPKFWALEGGAKLSTTVQGAVVYPYTMQDHLSRTKVDRTYKALFLENEYLKVTCLPELGGRIHSVLDKTQNKEMFYLNHVIKPGMIAMRGAWISGGIEWNAGPHGHTVTAVSPVTAGIGRYAGDDDPFIEITNLEKISRTRWTVLLRLEPGVARLDETIQIDNPTDGMHPYYFWNCTAFPNRPGTRFIYPMSLGTDHNAREFFRWPVDKGRDLTWLKNYPTYQSIFAVDCRYDFFGAYDVDADRGIVAVADHNRLPGKKAWTWGEWEFGKVAQKNLTDEDGPYIEVQSGPLPTQSDYGMLLPHTAIRWREHWYPVHGLGEGFEYANEYLAAQTIRKGGRLELRLLATASFPVAVCSVVSKGGRPLLEKSLDLAPDAPRVLALDDPGQPVAIAVKVRGETLAEFTSPLPIRRTDPPDPAQFVEKPDEQLSVEELYLKGRKFDRATDRRNARTYYEKTLDRDPGHARSLCALAVLDFEAGLYERAIPRLEKALQRDREDGLCWFYLGACRLALGDLDEAMHCAGKIDVRSGVQDAADCLVGRVCMLERRYAQAQMAFTFRGYGGESRMAFYAKNRYPGKSTVESSPTDLAVRILASFGSDAAMRRYGPGTREFLGEPDFELVEVGLQFARLGMFADADRAVRVYCVDAVPHDKRSPLPIYWLAWFAHKQNKEKEAAEYLALAAKTYKDKEFASRAEEVPVLKYAIEKNPTDGQAHFQLGCLLANLGRVDEAVPEWHKAAELATPSAPAVLSQGEPSSKPSPPAPLPKREGSKEPSPPAPLPKGEGRYASIAWRNLGLAAAAKDNDLPKAEGLYRKAIACRPSDQTLYRDLAEILLAQGKRPDAIKLMETMPHKGVRRAEITVMLAQAYVDEKRWGDCIKHLEGTPYFVNWEGQDLPWRLFNRAHIEQGRQRMDKKDFAAALADFEAALTYPANLNVGRSDKPQEAPAQYWRGKALAALGRADDARQAWKLGAEGADLPGEQNDYRQKCREALSAGKE